MNNGDIKLVIDQLHGVELDPDTDEVIIFNTVNLLETLGNKVIEQAAFIDTLREALNLQLNDCINFDGGLLTNFIMEESTAVLAIPTDSKQILAVWLREQLGEPVAWDITVHETQTCYLVEDVDEAMDDLTNHGAIAIPLFKLPDILK